MTGSIINAVIGKTITTKLMKFRKQVAKMRL
jgi:hypothetical protein